MIRIGLIYLIILLANQLALSQTECDCWENEFTEQGLDYSTSFKTMEKVLIDQGYLKDEKPSSYLRLLDSIISNNSYDLFLLDTHSVFISSFEKCFLFNSCDKRIYEKFKKMSNQLHEYQTVSPKETFSDFKMIFDKQDFSKTEVKHYFLTFYLSIFPNLNSDTLISDKERNNEDVFEPHLNQNTLKIDVAQNDLIYVNNNLTELENLKELAIDHITGNMVSQNLPNTEVNVIGEPEKSEQVIVFTCHSSSSYSVYLEVHDQLKAAYNEVRNDIGLKEFGISYEEMLLNREKYEREIKKVRTLVPLKVSEAKSSD